MNWTYDPTDYTEQDFAPIPEGDYRVHIAEVKERTFNSGNEGFELTLEVNGFKSKLWHYLVLDPSDRKKTNQRLGTFFDSFGITDVDLSHYTKWVGKTGAVSVKHEEFNGKTQAKVKWLIAKRAQDKLPAWSSGISTAKPEYEVPDLPFD